MISGNRKSDFEKLVIATAYIKYLKRQIDNSIVAFRDVSVERNHLAVFKRNQTNKDITNKKHRKLVTNFNTLKNIHALSKIENDNLREENSKLNKLLVKEFKKIC